MVIHLIDYGRAVPLVLLFLLGFNLSAQEYKTYYGNNSEETQSMSYREFCYFAHETLPLIHEEGGYEAAKRRAYLYNTFNLYYPTGIFDECLDMQFLNAFDFHFEVTYLFDDDTLCDFGGEFMYIREDTVSHWELFYYKIGPPDIFSEEARLVAERKEGSSSPLEISVKNVMMASPKEGQFVLVSVSVPIQGTFFEGGVSLEYQTVDGAAIGGKDYKPISGSIFLNIHRPYYTILVETFNDVEQDEPLEDFHIEFKNPKGAVLPEKESKITISIGNVP